MILYKIRNKVKKIDFVQNRGSSQEKGKVNLYKISTNEFVQNNSKISSGVSKIKVLTNLFFFYYKEFVWIIRTNSLYFRGMKNE